LRRLEARGVILAPLVLALVTAQRLGELVLARHNTRRLLARGAIEIAPGHYPAIIACHTLWLASLWRFGWSRPLEVWWLVLFCLLQVMRCWILATLKSRWTTRIIVVPGETLVRRGPYRFIPHPNYAVVVAEIACLPLVFGLWRVALGFTLVNAVVLFIRIRAENRALGRRSSP
jgi:methyltransferase